MGGNDRGLEGDGRSIFKLNAPICGGEVECFGEAGGNRLGGLGLRSLSD